MKELVVKCDGVEQRFDDAAFPLPLGGAHSPVAVPGWGRKEPAAFIGREGAGFHLQPGPLPFPLLRNGEAIGEITALRHEDRVRIGRAELAYFEVPGEAHALLVVSGEPKPAEDDAAAAPIRPADLAAPPPRPKRERPSAVRRVGMALVLLVLALAAAGAAFLLSARTVRFSFSPTPDAFSLEGPWPVLRLGEDHLLRPGEYRMRARLAGYRELSQAFRVGEEPRQAREFSLVKLPGKVTLRVTGLDDPARALAGGRVRVDGADRGALPFAGAEVEAGERRFEIELPDYLPGGTNLTVRGMGEAQSAELALTPSWSWIGVASAPPGAAVAVDGEVKGATPLRLKLPQGEHRIALALPLHIGAQTQITVRAHAPMDLPSFRLALSPGKLRVVSEPPGAALVTSFLYSGLTPAEVEVTARVDHQIRLSKAGYEDAVLTARVEPEETLERAVRLKELLGTLLLRVDPPDAALTVDGRPLKPGVTRVELRAVPVVVEAAREGFKPARKTVTPRPGLEIEVALRLEPIAPPAPPPPPKALAAPDGTPLTLVQPRDFACGSPRNEQGRRSNETLRAMRMTRPFYLGVKEVSNAQFRAFLAAHDSGSFQGRPLNGDDLPAVNLTWQQAAAYCNWLSAKEGLPPAYVEQQGKLVAVHPMTTGYRLPSEAEWEFTARLKDGKPVLRYPWGLEMPPAPKSGNYADLSAKGLVQQFLDGYQDGHAVAAPPGSFPAGEAGLFDLGGNVAEWAHDPYDITPPLEEQVFTDYLGPAEGPLHVIKGASWMHGTLARLRLAYRDYGDDPRLDVGFRVARYAK